MSLHRYRITYRDDSDPGCPRMTWHTRAADARHAEERFLDGPDSDGWEILKVERVPEVSR